LVRRPRCISSRANPRADDFLFDHTANGDRMEAEIAAALQAEHRELRSKSEFCLFAITHLRIVPTAYR